MNLKRTQLHRIIVLKQLESRLQHLSGTESAILNRESGGSKVTAKYLQAAIRIGDSESIFRDSTAIRLIFVVLKMAQLNCLKSPKIA